MKNEYVIRLDEIGFFGKRPFRPVPREDASKVLNRINGRMMKDGNATIEPA